jgi:hypothetical protein
MNLIFPESPTPQCILKKYPRWPGSHPEPSLSHPGAMINSNNTNPNPKNPDPYKKGRLPQYRNAMNRYLSYPASFPS